MKKCYFASVEDFLEQVYITIVLVIKTTRKYVSLKHIFDIDFVILMFLCQCLKWPFSCHFKT